MKFHINIREFQHQTHNKGFFIIESCFANDATLIYVLGIPGESMSSRQLMYTAGESKQAIPRKINNGEIILRSAGFSCCNNIISLNINQRKKKKKKKNIETNVFVRLQVKMFRSALHFRKHIAQEVENLKTVINVN